MTEDNLQMMRAFATLAAAHVIAARPEDAGREAVHITHLADELVRYIKTGTVEKGT